MSNLDGKVICNAFMRCDDECNHRIPHERVMFCAMSCKNGGTCVPIEVFWVDDKREYAVKMQDGNYHKIPEDPAPAIPDFNMDERIYICPSHASCPYDDCSHKQFHNRKDNCETECHRVCVGHDFSGVTCREANSDEILQLFKDHQDENQHIKDMIKRDDQIYLDAMDEPTKPKPERPKPTHERVQRFLNLEL